MRILAYILCAAIGFLVGYQVKAFRSFWEYETRYCKDPSARAIQGCELVMEVALADKEEAEEKEWICQFEKKALINSNEAFKKTLDCMLSPDDCRSPSEEEMNNGATE